MSESFCRQWEKPSCSSCSSCSVVQNVPLGHSPALAGGKVERHNPQTQISSQLHGIPKWDHSFPTHTPVMFILGEGFSLKLHRAHLYLGLGDVRPLRISLFAETFSSPAFPITGLHLSRREHRDSKAAFPGSGWVCPQQLQALGCGRNAENKISTLLYCVPKFELQIRKASLSGNLPLPGF